MFGLCFRMTAMQPACFSNPDLRNYSGSKCSTKNEMKKSGEGYFSSFLKMKNPDQI